MTWTVILFDGHIYTSSGFHGSHDQHVAMKEVTEKFRLGLVTGARRWVVALVPGDHPVYTHE